MKQLPKPVIDSVVNLSKIVFPADANSVGSVFGGRLLEWMDMAASICARRHSKKRIATAALNNVTFIKPVYVGDVANIKASVNRVFKVSMEIGVKIVIEDTTTGQTKHACSGYFYMVSLGENGKPVKAIDVFPKTKEEERRWKDAGFRYELNKKYKNKYSG